MKNSLVVLIIFFLGGCSFFQEKGPCTYKEVRFKARVEKIDTLGENAFDVYLSFNNSQLYKELQSLKALKQIEVMDSFFLKNNKIKPGIYYTGIVSETSDEHCRPFYISFNQGFK